MTRIGGALDIGATMGTFSSMSGIRLVRLAAPCLDVGSGCPYGPGQPVVPLDGRPLDA